MFVIFFFQAEDGIRDFCLSRGLGDVYKRQLRSRHPAVAWKLMLTMLPEPHAIAIPTHAPHYREWRPSVLGVVAPPQRRQVIADVVARLRADAGRVPERWVS